MGHSSPLKSSNRHYLALEYIFHHAKLQMQRQTSGKMDILILCHKYSHHHHSSKYLPMIWFCRHRFRHSVGDEIVLGNLPSSGHCNPIVSRVAYHNPCGTKRWQELFYKQQVEISVECTILQSPDKPQMDNIKLSRKNQKKQTKFEKFGSCREIP